MTRIFRVVGDSGVLARISVTLTDAEGSALTSGTTTLRADGLFTGEMTHQADGVWIYDPVEGDISAAGSYEMDVEHDTVSLPADEAHRLVVRSPVTGPQP